MSVVPYDVLSLAFPGQFMVFFVFVYLSHSYQFVSVSSTTTTTGNNHFIKRNDVLWMFQSMITWLLLPWVCDRWHITVVALSGTHYSPHSGDG
jgi:hypothetical protein